ncbi:MAG: LytTR family DNA-binding domain-containing protein [Chitinophagaceae bacterium]
MVNCLIVDDEPLAQKVLQKYIQQTEGLELAGSCFNATEAFSILHQQPVDLMFLDIKMPFITGTEFVQSLKNPPAFIFTTAYGEFAVMSYELHALDYLLKPITYERFRKSVDRFLQQQHTTPQEPQKDYIYIKTDGNLVKLFYRDILYAQSLKDYIKVVTHTGSYLTHLTMKSLEQLLPEHLFRRVHRSYIVNMQHLSIIGKDSVVVGKTTIPVGENYKGNLPNA